MQGANERLGAASHADAGWPAVGAVRFCDDIGRRGCVVKEDTMSDELRIFLILVALALSSLSLLGRKNKGTG